MGCHTQLNYCQLCKKVPNLNQEIAVSLELVNNACVLQINLYSVAVGHVPMFPPPHPEQIHPRVTNIPYSYLSLFYLWRCSGDVLLHVFHLPTAYPNNKQALSWPTLYHCYAR